MKKTIRQELEAIVGQAAKEDEEETVGRTAREFAYDITQRSYKLGLARGSAPAEQSTKTQPSKTVRGQLEAIVGRVATEDERETGGARTTLEFGSDVAWRSYRLGLANGSAPNLTRSEAKYLLKIIRGQTKKRDLLPMQRALKQLRQIAGEEREYRGRKKKGNRP